MANLQLRTLKRDITRRASVVLLFALLMAAGAVAGFYQIFSNFLGYDDEGYLMLSVQGFLDGRPLYDQVYTQYGPSYYLYKATLHCITGWPVSNDSVRLMTIAAWLLATLFCSLFTYRVTGSLFVATAAFLLTYRSLWMISNEPGHPQELCAVLLAAGVYLSSYVSSAKRLLWVLLCLGALAAALVLTKINSGFYFCMALAGAMATSADSLSFRRAATGLLFALAFVVPVGLMCNHIDVSEVRSFAAVATLSSVSALAVAAVRSTRGIISLNLAAAAFGFLATILLEVLGLLACGTSAAGLWDGVVAGPIRSGWHLFMPVIIPSVIPASIAAAAAIGYCLGVAGLIKLPVRFAAALLAMSNLIRMLLVIEVVLVLTAVHGTLNDLLAFATPWIWLAMVVPPHRHSALGNEFSRKMVVLVCAFQMLYAYPVGGGQLSIASFLVVPAAAICAHDLWLQLRSSHLRVPGKVVAAGTLMGYALIALQWWSSCHSFQTTYSNRTPLNLPGARWIRVPQETAAVLRCVSINLRDNCDTFFSAPGLNSFYFWSELKPPTGFNAGHWATFLSDDQKRAIVVQLEQHPRAWLVYYPKLLEFWLRISSGSQSDDPLERYCKEHFEPMVQVGPYDLCLPKGQQRPLLEAAANINPLPTSVSSHFSDFGLPNSAAPNVIVQLRLTPETRPQPALARVIIVDAANGNVLADSHTESLLGMKILDADLHPVKLPLSPGWNHDMQSKVLSLVPFQAWLLPRDYDYSKVLAGLYDADGKLIACLPVTIALGQAAQ